MKRKRLSGGKLVALLLIATGRLGSPASVPAQDARDQPKLSTVRAADFSPDGRFLATVSGEPKDPGVLVVWDVTTKQPHFVHREIVGIPAVAYAPDGKTLAIGLFEPVAKLLDARSGAVVRTFEGHGNHVRSVAFSKSGDRLVTASYDRTAKLWEVSTGKPLMSFE